MIMCLDQEKAYNKILHVFLWRVMKKFGFPKEFIDTVKALYSDAYTKVILNGEMSKGYKVTQGVHQGDPLSCLLFNIAIESLAQMLRLSELKGIITEEEAERLIATLFADNTTIYLNEEDSFQDLQKLLREWCTALETRFNIPKTVIVPVGAEWYRRELITRRRTKNTSQVIPENIKIAGKGEATRRWEPL